MAKPNARQQQRDDMTEAIKSAARQQMTDEGTASISLRAIARILDITAPALYRYFTNRDDLITDLIVDAFNALADALVAADATQAREDYGARLITVLMAYRQWAIDHPTDFKLIYGNPIPGYNAPREVTVAAASRPFYQVIEIVAAAHADGILQPAPEALDLPASIEAHLNGLSEQDGYQQPSFILYITVVGWSRIHGMIMLELFDNTQPVIGDTEAFYRHEITEFCKSMNLIPKS
ncbi:MAG: TetR family transcriptional regulator [Chloroflexi bacterium]|nr:TetR family transcriptional regulator [Chloroflexota bacterium]